MTAAWCALAAWLVLSLPLGIALARRLKRNQPPDAGPAPAADDSAPSNRR